MTTEKLLQAIARLSKKYVLNPTDLNRQTERLRAAGGITSRARHSAGGGVRMIATEKDPEKMQEE